MRTSSVVIVLASLLTFVSSSFAQTTWYVDDDIVLGTGDGTSWATAYPYLQDALEQAVSGDEIRVAHGTYVTDRSEAHREWLGDRSIEFAMIHSVNVLGAYNGAFGGGDPDARDFSIPTVLTGDLNGDDVMGSFANHGENAYHVVQMIVAPMTLDGFEIRGGFASAASGDNASGGGIWTLVSNSIIRRCAIYACKANDRGGGLFVGGTGSTVTPLVESCLFYDVEAARGAAWAYDDLTGGSIRNTTVYYDAPVITEAIGWHSSSVLSVSIQNSIIVARPPVGFKSPLIGGNGPNAVSVSSTVLSPILIGTSGVPITLVSRVLDLNPLFMDAAARDFRLRTGSPCIDQGAGNLTFADTDLEGNPRLLDDPGMPDPFGGDSVDLGAFEFTGTSAFAGVLYVDDTAPDDGNGLSWGNATPFLQDALAVAEILEGEQEIRIAEGIYRPDRRSSAPMGTGDPLDVFVITPEIDSIALRGGYPDGGGFEVDRNPFLFESVLSGDLAGDDLPNWINQDENAQGVILVPTGHTGLLTLDGLVVAGGNRTTAKNGGVESIGGALLLDFGTSADIDACIFRDNQALTAGVFFFRDDVVATVTNSLCVRNRNTTLWGGIAWILSNTDILFRNCTMADNESPTGIFDLNGASGLNAVLVIENSILRTAAGNPFRHNDSFTELTVRYSNFNGPLPAVGTVTTDGNIDAPPDFLDAPNDDYRLFGLSAGVDAGDNNVVPQIVTQDLAKQSRFLDVVRTADTGLPDGLRGPIDMGAFEADGETTAFAGDTQWTNGAGGNFHSFVNWFPGIPGPSNRALFLLPDTYTVNLAEPTENARLLAAFGDVTLDLNGFDYTLNSNELIGLMVGELSGDDGTLRLANGTLSAETCEIGRADGATGRLIIDDATVLLQDDVCVGCDGAGTLEIVNAGELVSVIGFVGRGPTSSGDVLIDGPDARWTLPLLISLENGSIRLANGGTLEAGFGVAVTPDGIVYGEGVVEGLTVNFGVFAPGGDGTVGTLTVNGTYEQLGNFPGLGDAAGTLSIDVDPNGGAPVADRLVVNGNVTLGGGLVVSAPTGFDPTDTDTLNILSAGTLNGAFDVALLPAIVPDAQMQPRFLNLMYGGTGPGGEQITITVEDLKGLIGFNPILPDAPIADTPQGLAVGDLSGDGVDDLAIVVTGAAGPGSNGTLVVLVNDGTGQSFESFLYSVGVDPVDVTIGNFDDAGFNDVGVANAGSDSVSIVREPGTVGGSVLPEQVIGAGPSGIGTIDVAGQTHDDLALSLIGDGEIAVLVNDGSGMLTDSLRLPGDGPTVIDPTDLDNNKSTTDDIAFVESGTDSIVIYPSVGGTYDENVTLTLPAATGTTDVALRDVDGDLLADVVAANLGSAIGEGTVTVFLNTTAGAVDFAPGVTLPAADFAREITAGDFDGDGDTDLAILGGATEAVVQVLRNDLIPGGSLIFAPDQDPPASVAALLLDSGNLDGDTGEDLVTINDPNGSSPAGPPPPVSLLLTGPPRAPCLTDLDRSGATDFGDLVTILSSWGPCPGCAADLDGDGVIGFTDLVSVLTAWGPC